MQVTTITHICSAVDLYANSFAEVSAIPVNNISTIYPIITGVTSSLSSQPLSAFGNISLIASTINPYVSAL